MNVSLDFLLHDWQEKMYCRTVYGFHIHQYISYKPKMAFRQPSWIFVKSTRGIFGDFMGIHKWGKEDTSLKISAFYNTFPPTYLMLLHYNVKEW